MKIRLNKLPGLLAALKATDGTPSSPFKYAAKFTWNRTKNIKLLQREFDAMQEHGQTLLTKGSADPLNPTEDELKKVNQEFTELQKVDTDISGLLLFRRDDFNLFDPVANKTGNVIPAQVLAELDVLTEPEPVTADSDQPPAIAPGE